MSPHLRSASSPQLEPQGLQGGAVVSQRLPDLRPIGTSGITERAGDQRVEAANQIAVDVDRYVDAFLRPPMTQHAAIFFPCGGYWRRACTCGYISGPRMSELAAQAEPCPRHRVDMIHRLRLAADKDAILEGLRALAAGK